MTRSAHSRLALAVAAYALVALACAVAAYLAIFSQFAPYDDEGTLLVSLWAFADGDTLYRDVYSIYGPFYYELFGGFFALTGVAVTTEASRTIVIVVWIATSLLYGVAAQLLSGRVSIGVAAMIVSFGVLYVLVGEPMHPQGLSALLLGGFTLLAVAGPGRRSRALGGGCGALLAALLMTKVNLGAFAIAAVALASVLTLEPLARRSWLRWPVLAGFLVLPLAIAARDLDTGWVREFVATEVFAGLAIVVAAWPLRPRRGEGDTSLRRWLEGAAAGFALALVAILAAILALGVGVGDVYDGVVREAIRVRDVLITPFPLSRAWVVLAGAAVAAAALARRGWLRRFGEAAPWPALLRALAGLAIWVAVVREVPGAFGATASTNPDAVPLVLAWVASIPPAGRSERGYKRFLRVLLPALAVAETLQVYPVAGSQMGIAALTFVPVGAICLDDALASLRAWGQARGARARSRLRWARAATPAIALAFAAVLLVRPVLDDARAYRDLEPLSFPGASRLRLPAAEVEAYTRLVELLHRHRCTTFIGYPNIDSLYLWSGIEPPPPAPPGAWIEALDAERQQRVVEEMRASPRPCAIRSYGRAELWLHGEQPPRRPLVRYVLDEFEPVASAGEFEFLLPRERDPGRAAGG